MRYSVEYEEGCGISYSLMDAVLLALELSEVLSGEVAVYQSRRKVAGFTAGKRTFPISRYSPVGKSNKQRAVGKASGA